jgi:SAM-dependent methyltransferase
MASALQAWLEQINAHESESAVLRGGEPGHGHGHGGGGARSQVRQDNPDRTDDPVLNALYEVVDASTTVLDVGGGAGRYAIPLASRAKHVTVVEPSGGSVEELESIASERGIANITVIQSDWDTTKVEQADIVLCSLVLHHVSDVEPFIRKMGRKAKHRVMAVEMMEFPGMIESPFYQRVHDSNPTPLPAIADIMRVLWEMDIYPDLEMFPSTPPVLETDKVGALEYLRRRIAVVEGTPEDDRLQSAMTELLQETPGGLVVKGVKPQRLGIVSWRP